MMSSAALLFLMLLVLSGCAPSALSSARREMASGQYAAARHDLRVLQDRQNTLNAAQRREFKDDLCLADAKIGEPTYGLTEQRRACTDALQEPGSRSGPLLAQIDESIRQSASARVNAALARDDLDAAEQAAVGYASIPGADPALIRQWSINMWAVVDRRDHRARHREVATATAIRQVRGRYPQVKSMGKEEFLRWIARQGTVGGNEIFSSVVLADHRLNLAISRRDIRATMLNLDRLATVNDGLVARCNCDGRTKVSAEPAGFPLYLVRLDPETRQSELLIFPR